MEYELLFSNVAGTEKIGCFFSLNNIFFIPDKLTNLNSFLFSINFTEDGAEAIWAKAKIDFDAIAQSLKEVS